MSLLRDEDSIRLRDTSVTPVAEVSTITTIADVAGALAGKHFLLFTPVNEYYVWYRLDLATGVDPVIPGKRGIMVDIATGDLDTVVASQTQIAIDAETEFGAVVALAVVTVTNASTGVVADIADVDSGFTLAATVQGVDAADMVINCKYVNRAPAGSVINVIGGEPDLGTVYDLSGATPAFEVTDSNYTGLAVYTKNITV